MRPAELMLQCIARLVDKDEGQLVLSLPRLPGRGRMRLFGKAGGPYVEVLSVSDQGTNVAVSARAVADWLLDKGAAWVEFDGKDRYVVDDMGRIQLKVRQ